MEKRVWNKPLAQVEQFMANEYIAKCSDTVNKFYNFVCDAGGGTAGDVWEGGTVNERKTRISGGTLLTEDWLFSNYYHACDASHYVPEAALATTFTSGYYNKGTYDDSREGNFIPVVIWTDGGTDVHCTESLAENIQVVQGNKS